jgi:hypothetical protein
MKHLSSMQNEMNKNGGNFLDHGVYSVLTLLMPTVIIYISVL